jgi:arylsulfatase A-like enzyme
MIRDERWKLIAYHTGEERNAQLFDLSVDPDEVDNLADDSKYAGEMARLEKLMSQARADFGDPVKW